MRFLLALVVFGGTVAAQVDPPTIPAYRLKPDSPYSAAGTDGRPLGADIDALIEADRCARAGNCHPDQTTPAPLRPSGLRIVH